MAKMNYDLKEDILFLSKEKKVKKSIDVGDFIIDIDYKGFVSGIEILDASKNLDIPASVLKSLKQASMQVSYKQGYVLIKITMILKNKEKDLSIPLTVNLGHSNTKSEKAIFAVVSS